MTNVIDVIGLDHETAEQLAEQAIGHYGWLVVAAFFAFLFKDFLVNFVAGVMVYWGSNFKNDEILYISGRQARVIRMGITSCVFYMHDRKSLMVVPCSQLKCLTVEKRLPTNGGECYLPKGSELNPIEISLVDPCKSTARKSK